MLLQLKNNSYTEEQKIPLYFALAKSFDDQDNLSESFKYLKLGNDGQKNIIKAMNKIQGQATSCANSISQAASVEALLGDQSAVKMMRDKYKKRRDLIVSLLNEIPGVYCDLPGGAFYAFPDFSAYIGKSYQGAQVTDSFELANLFLNEAKVVTVPGDGFGAPGHIRFSYPMARDVIREGINRVRKILEELN